MSDLMVRGPLLCTREALLSGDGDPVVRTAARVIGATDRVVAVERCRPDGIRGVDIWSDGRSTVIHDRDLGQRSRGLVVDAHSTAVHVARLWSSLLGPIASAGTDAAIEFHVERLGASGGWRPQWTAAVTVAVERDGDVVDRVVTLQHTGGTAAARVASSEVTAVAHGVSALSAWTLVDDLLARWRQPLD